MFHNWFSDVRKTVQEIFVVFALDIHCRVLTLDIFRQRRIRWSSNYVESGYIELTLQDTIETEPRSTSLMKVEQMFDTITGFVNLFMNIRTLKYYGRCRTKIRCTDLLNSVRVNPRKLWTYSQIEFQSSMQSNLFSDNIVYIVLSIEKKFEQIAVSVSWYFNSQKHAERRFAFPVSPRFCFISMLPFHSTVFDLIYYFSNGFNYF